MFLGWWWCKTRREKRVSLPLPKLVTFILIWELMFVPFEIRQDEMPQIEGGQILSAI